jgi:hypothetical protein
MYHRVSRKDSTNAEPAADRSVPPTPLLALASQIPSQPLQATTVASKPYSYLLSTLVIAGYSPFFAPRTLST